MGRHLVCGSRTGDIGNFRAIGSAIVGDNYLQRSVGLVQDGPKGFRKIDFAIEDWNHTADQRRCHMRDASTFSQLNETAPRPNLSMECPRDLVSVIEGERIFHVAIYIEFGNFLRQLLLWLRLAFAECRVAAFRQSDQILLKPLSDQLVNSLLRLPDVFDSLIFTHHFQRQCGSPRIPKHMLNRKSSVISRFFNQCSLDGKQPFYCTNIRKPLRVAAN